MIGARLWQGSPAEGGDGACVEGAETITRGDGAVGTPPSTIGWKDAERSYI